jgi:hypothetical protein
MRRQEVPMKAALPTTIAADAAPGETRHGGAREDRREDTSQDGTGHSATG